MWDTGCQRNPLSICCLGSTQCETDSFVMERGGVARMSGVGRSGRGTVSRASSRSDLYVRASGSRPDCRVGVAVMRRVGGSRYRQDTGVRR